MKNPHRHSHARAYYAALVTLGALSLAGCTSTSAPQTEQSGTPDEVAEVVELAVAEATLENVMAQNQRNHAEESDIDYEKSGATTISLSGTKADISGKGASASDGNVVINAEGTYILSGNYSGSIRVEAGDKDKVRLVLNGVSIETDSAAINAVSGNELVVILAEDTKNVLVDVQAEAHAQAAAQESTSIENSSSTPSGAIESHIDTTIGGTGTLSLSGGANALSCSDGLTIYSGTLNVTSIDDGIRGKDYVWIEGGDISISAGGDAIQATNDTEGERGFIYIADGMITVSKSDKAIDAVTDLVIAGGKLDVTSTDDSLEAAYILLVDGSAEVTSGDDPINARADSGNPWISVLGGTWVLEGKGDGFDSNGAARIAGGSVSVFGPENGGNGAIDTATGLEMAGGTLFAIGSQGMDEGPALDSPQATVKFTGNFSAGSTITISNSSGDVLARYDNRTRGQSVFFSSPDIVTGQTYTISIDDNEVASGVAGSYAENRMDDPGTMGEDAFGGEPPAGGMPDGGMPDGGAPGMQPPTRP